MIKCQWYFYVICKALFKASFKAPTFCQNLTICIVSEFSEIWLVCTITHHRFRLESPNVHQTCILGCSQLVLKMEVIIFNGELEQYSIWLYIHIVIQLINWITICMYSQMEYNSNSPLKIISNGFIERKSLALHHLTFTSMITVMSKPWFFVVALRWRCILRHDKIWVFKICI